MNILVIGDLHGEKPIIPKHLKFDCIIQIGDVCSDKKLSPLIKKWFNSLKVNPNETPDSEVFIEKQVGKKELRKIEKESLQEGRKIMGYLNSLGKPVFIVSGNWDQMNLEDTQTRKNLSRYAQINQIYKNFLNSTTNKKLTKGLENIKDCHYKAHKFEGVNIIGYGLPEGASDGWKRLGKWDCFNKKQLLHFKKMYFKIIQKLDLEFKKIDPKLPTIFITHNSPCNTKLDIVKEKSSPAYGEHKGSDIVRDICIKHHPTMSIGGHIHESKGIDKIGKTIIINAGYGKKAIVLVSLDTKNNKIKQVKFL